MHPTKRSLPRGRFWFHSRHVRCPSPHARRLRAVLPSRSLRQPMRTQRATSSPTSKTARYIVRSFGRSSRASKGTRKSAGCPTSPFVSLAGAPEASAAARGGQGSSGRVVRAVRAVREATRATAIVRTGVPVLPAPGRAVPGAASRDAADRRRGFEAPVSHGRAARRSARDNHSPAILSAIFPKASARPSSLHDGSPRQHRHDSCRVSSHATSTNP